MVRRDPDEFIDTFGALSRCLRALVADSYAKLELGSTQGKFLRHIGRNGRMSQADLARATATDPALTGRALQTLIERGWVRRKRSDEDKRQYVLELSPSGQRIVKRVEQARTELGARIVAELDERDSADFERVARKLLAAFQAPSD